MQDKRAQKEANLRKEHAREMESMIQECKEELAQERAKIDEDHAGKLAALREEQDEGFQEVSESCSLTSPAHATEQSRPAGIPIVLLCRSVQLCLMRSRKRWQNMKR